MHFFGAIIFLEKIVTVTYAILLSVVEEHIEDTACVTGDHDSLSIPVEDKFTISLIAVVINARISRIGYTGNLMDLIATVIFVYYLMNNY